MTITLSTKKSKIANEIYFIILQCYSNEICFIIYTVIVYSIHSQHGRTLHIQIMGLSSWIAYSEIDFFSFTIQLWQMWQKCDKFMEIYIVKSWFYYCCHTCHSCHAHFMIFSEFHIQKFLLWKIFSYSNIINEFLLYNLSIFCTCYEICDFHQSVFLFPQIFHNSLYIFQC